MMGSLPLPDLTTPAVVIFQARDGIGGKAIMEGFDDPIIRIKPTRIVS
jgi:hypothetical protein